MTDSVPRIKQYLLSKGVPENEITVSSVSSTTLHGKDKDGNESADITGYSLRQELQVRANDVERYLATVSKGPRPGTKRKATRQQSERSEWMVTRVVHVNYSVCFGWQLADQL